VVTGSQDGTNPAQIRGDIQAGRTRDKRPGFDPAAAPLETDAEAGGVAFNAEDVRIARRQNQSNPGHENSSHATAMRRAGDASYRRHAGWPRTLFLVLGCAVIVTLVFITFLWR
jgi:hypothetical protein